MVVRLIVFGFAKAACSRLADFKADKVIGYARSKILQAIMISLNNRRKKQA